MEVTVRRQRLIDLLAVRRFVHLQEAARHTGASVATLRRDFASLAEAGVAQRFRGGIRLPQADAMLPFALRDQLFSNEKLRLAQQAAAMVRPGDVLFIDGGTTTAHLAACLPDIPLRIVTNSLRLAAMVDDRVRSGALEVYVTGGCVHPRSGILVGPSAASSVAQYRAHLAILSVGGITADGLFNTTEAVVETERQMIAFAERSVVLADHSKINKPSMCRVCGLDQIDILILDASPTCGHFGEALRQNEVQLVLART